MNTMADRSNDLITSWEIGKALTEAGLIPEKTKRIAVDIDINETPTVIFTTIGNKALLDAIWPHLDRFKVRELIVQPNSDGTYTAQIRDREPVNVHRPQPSQVMIERCDHIRSLVQNNILHPEEGVGKIQAIRKECGLPELPDAELLSVVQGWKQ